MEQGLQAKGPVVGEVWVEDEVEAEWAVHLQRGREAVVYARTVATKSLTSRGSLVMQ